MTQRFAVVRVVLKVKLPIRATGQEIPHDELERIQDDLHDQVRDFYTDALTASNSGAETLDVLSEIVGFED